MNTTNTAAVLPFILIDNGVNIFLNVLTVCNISLVCFLFINKFNFCSSFCSDDHRTLLNQWIMSVPESFHELDLLEPILSLRTILLQELHLLSLGGRRQCLLSGLVTHCEMVSKLARHAGRYQVSLT